MGGGSGGIFEMPPSVVFLSACFVDAGASVSPASLGALAGFVALVALVGPASAASANGAPASATPASAPAAQAPSAAPRIARDRVRAVEDGVIRSRAATR